jgi:hypothetical protein
MYKRLLFLLFTLSLVLASYAQFNEAIQSGRPGQAIGPFTVGNNIFQMQNGFDYNHSSDGNYNYVLNDFNSVFRYGITENFELGLGLNYYAEKSELGTFSKSISGLNSFSLRMRSNVYVGRGFIPSVGYQFTLGLPIVSEVYKSKNLAPKITIVTGQEITSKIDFTTNFGLSWDGNTPQASFFYVLNLWYSLNEKWSLFIENYGAENIHSIDTKFDGGFAFLANNNLQLDLFGGYDQSENGFNDWFVSVGFSWRLNLKKEDTNK